MHLTYSNIDYLGCEDCDRLRAVDPNDDQGECSDPKEGCKKLLAGLGYEVCDEIAPFGKAEYDLLKSKKI